MISRLSDLARKVSPLVSVSVGNQIDMSNVDFMEWLLEDDSAQKFLAAFGERCEALEELDREKKNIRVFGMYIEGLNDNDGAKLLRLLQKCRDQGKLVFIYKTGRTA